MCGRYTIIRLVDFAEMFPWIHKLGDTDDLFLPRYNVAPSQMCPIVRMNKNDEPVLSMAKWGLIPSWTKGKPKIAPINAKCETSATSGMFRQAMERRRCLVPADGFYEWQGAKPPKQPHFIHMRDDSMFAFAGLWERWKPDGASEPIDTFAIITTQPNKLMAPIHNRMPVILEQGAFDRWLKRDNGASDVADLLRPFDADRMESWKVSTNVNKTEHQRPELIEKIE